MVLCFLYSDPVKSYGLTWIFSFFSPGNHSVGFNKEFFIEFLKSKFLRKILLSLFFMIHLFLFRKRFWSENSIFVSNIMGYVFFPILFFISHFFWMRLTVWELFLVCIVEIESSYTRIVKPLPSF